ncbi:hypothetical protein D3870_20915 [Noviherbaspirillum cavernae]|uniref:Uncharacterized protein n=1 Tax=Noviherbaspirillum cavernae TaxID=2320862 RepID=A0A418WW14_9BURK|nr:hypothetical protein [Noviherbaspirillum cavernae]RJF96847.1 hypothetical protein D3870_20915 [Noviherbaspirillum cavernae]
MTALIRLIRRVVIRWQIRSLDEQDASIVEARNHALKHLMEIRRERSIKEVELWLHESAPAQRAAA